MVTSLTKVLLVLASALAASPLYAEISFRGYLSLGLAMSDRQEKYDNRIDRQANFQENTNFGLNIRSPLSKSWDVAAQIVANRSTNSSSLLDLNWAFATYKPMSNVSIYFGKQLLPVWYASEYRDVGHAYLWVVPPEEVYHLNLFRRFEGVNVAYKVYKGLFDVDLQVYGGSDSGVKFPISRVADHSFNIKQMGGAQLNFSYATYLLRFGYLSSLVDFVSLQSSLRNIEYNFASAGFACETGSFIFVAEHAHITGGLAASTKEELQQALDRELQRPQPDQAAIAAAAGLKAVGEADFVGHRSNYLTVGYRIQQKFIPNLTYAQVIAPEHSLWVGSQTSITPSIRYDISPNLDVKAGVKHVIVDDNSWGLFYDYLNASDTSAIKNTNIYQLALNLIF